MFMNGPFDEGAEGLNGAIDQSGQRCYEIGICGRENRLAG